MKPIYYAVALIITVLLSLAMLNQPTRISYAEARCRIEELNKGNDIRLLNTKDFKGDAILGSTVEKSLREFFNLAKRETPFHLQDYQFRDSEGRFTVQLDMREGESLEIVVYTELSAKGPTSKTEKLLLSLFPGATFVPNP